MVPLIDFCFFYQNNTKAGSFFMNIIDKLHLFPKKFPWTNISNISRRDIGISEKECAEQKTSKSFFVTLVENGLIIAGCSQACNKTPLYTFILLYIYSSIFYVTLLLLLRRDFQRDFAVVLTLFDRCCYLNNFSF